MTTRDDLSARDWGVALAIAASVQVVSLVLLRSSGGSQLPADLRDDNAKPIAVSITPVVDDAPLLKLGGKRDPARLPDMWRAPTPVARTAAPASPATTPTPATTGALPSTKAEATPSAIPATATLADAAVAAPPDAEVTKQVDDQPVPADAAPPPNVATPGAADGVANGTETDPLKAHAVSLYRARLDAWFSARFPIRGKIPFDRLRTLRASVTVQISQDRSVTGFSLAATSGDETFDAELRRALAAIQSSGAELPPPPPLYPDVLGQSLHLVFSCTQRNACE